MTTYCATFGGVPCEIQVQAAVSVSGGPVYVSTAFVTERDGDVLRPIYNAGEHMEVELPGSDEATAVNRMVMFLEKKLGPMKGPTVICPERKSPQVGGARYDL